MGLPLSAVTLIGQESLNCGAGNDDDIAGIGIGDILPAKNSAHLRSTARQG